MSNRLQQWEYHRQLNPCEWDGNLTNTLAESMEWADKLGQQGWEMVSFTIMPSYSNGIGKGPSAVQASTRFQYQGWFVATVFKRPLTS